jgi:hypothetical protein
MWRRHASLALVSGCVLLFGLAWAVSRVSAPLAVVLALVAVLAPAFVLTAAGTSSGRHDEYVSDESGWQDVEDDQAP